MEIAAIVSLLTTFGPPAIKLIDDLIARAKSKGPVTPEEWATLSASLRQSAYDRTVELMKSKGIDPTTPESLAVLELTK